MYIKDQLNFKHRPDISVFIPHIFESIFIEIQSKHTNVIIGTIYRPNTPPKADLDIFENTLSELMHTIKHANKNVVIMGDFNIDLLKFEMHNKTNSYIDNISSNAYIPLITKPTRMTPHSVTLIDHIYTNDISRSYKSGIIITDIADHFSIFTIIQIIIDKPKPIFRNLLHKRTLLFNTVTAHEHPDTAYDQFMNIYADAYEEAFPLKTIKVRKKLIKQEPWVTKGLIISSINKDKLFRKKLNKPNAVNINNFSKYNIFNKIKRAAKKVYYTNIFATSL